MSAYLSRLLSSKAISQPAPYRRGDGEALPGALAKFARRADEYAPAWSPRTLFEELASSTSGPIDGHISTICCRS